jgi:hypothetical protein
MAVAALDILTFPDDVLAFELAIHSFYAPGLFKSRLARSDTYPLEF